MQLLQEAEYRVLERSRELTRLELEARQQVRELRMQVDRIPQLQDARDHWQQKRSEDLEKARMLDTTVDYLQKAKESLSMSYLAPIRDSFAGYMQQLAGEEPGKILVSPDLQVQLERFGEARELAYFSAGQTDLVLLCMRFALVDALFRDTKPFVILDDPFVNLDDRSTARALELLKELSKDRQIIYLVCNSSRNF
jgi:ABC-type glutathione transport system ATPase component